MSAIEPWLLPRDLADAQPDENIVLIKYALGNTDLAIDWQPPDAGGEGAGFCYITFMDTVNDALASLGTYEIAGMIWMQGEADAWDLSMAQVYEQNLAYFIDSMRYEFDVPYMPFIIGRISESEVWTYGDIVRQAQLNVSQTVPDTELVDTNDLPLLPDDMHYDTTGVMTLGRRFTYDRSNRWSVNL